VEIATNFLQEISRFISRIARYIGYDAADSLAVFLAEPNMASTFQSNLIPLRRRGGESSLSAMTGVELATLALQDRAHLATMTMYRGSIPVANSRANRNGHVADSVCSLELRENHRVRPGIQAWSARVKMVSAARAKNGWRRTVPPRKPVCPHTLATGEFSPASRQLQRVKIRQSDRLPLRLTTTR